MSLVLSTRQLCDLELILNGAFYPLIGFMNEEDYYSVLSNMKLSTGQLWPIPIILDISFELVKILMVGQIIILKDIHNTPVASMEIETIYKPNKDQEALSIYGTTDIDTHPSIEYLYRQIHDYYIGGPVKKLNEIEYYNYLDYRHSPRQLEEHYKNKNLKSIIGFQTRNPMHRAHYELTCRMLSEIQKEDPDAQLLLQPVVGLTAPGDIDTDIRIKCYLEILKYYQPQTVTLNLLPLAMRMAGPKEALWHALIRKNYGCTHFIVGRDHAGITNKKTGQSFYDPEAATDLVKRYEKELGIKILTSDQIVYVKNCHQYKSLKQVLPTDEILSLSGTQLRQLLKRGQEIPTWFTFTEIASILQKNYHQPTGLTIFFTGLSSSGKSTLAAMLEIRLKNLTDQPIIVLDGDEMRNKICSDLSFSQKDRQTNINRIGYIASLITKCRSIAIVSCIAPYNESRLYCRKIIENYGKFVQIYLNTDVSVCEKRDVKGLYNKARTGEILNFTGISDVYEIPTHSDLVLDTSKLSINECIDTILSYLKNSNFITFHQ